MPSSMKLQEPINTERGLKSTEKMQNRSLSERQKRPDMQIYVPRALRGTQKNCIPIGSMLKSKSAKSSINKNYQKISDERSLSLENKVEKYVDVSHSKNLSEVVEDFSHTTIPQTETTDNCNFIKSNFFDATSPRLLSVEQIAFSEISESLNPCLSDEQITSSEIRESSNPCISDELIAFSEISGTPSPGLISDEQITSSEISQSLNSCLSDKQITPSEISVAPSCRSTFEINIIDSNSSKKNDIFSPMITEESNILLVNDELSTEISDSPIGSKVICVESSENLSKVSTKIDINETPSVDNYSECIYQEKEDSWESKFDDDGECLNPEFLKDLKIITGQIEVLVAKNNYKGFVQESDNGGYDCIIELYGFPMEFNTQDLVSAFSQFQQASYSLKWVDDCHALAIFSSPSLANQALLMNHPFVKTRIISEGIKGSQEKAKWCTRHSEPLKPRPTTSAVLARRLVSGALGLRVQASKEQRDQERTILKEAKEKRKLKAKQKQAIWDGVVL